MLFRSGPPEQSGPNVYRGVDYSWFWFSANGLIAFVGIDIPDFCNGGWTLDQFEYHSIENPSDHNLWIDQAKFDDAMTFVYPASFALEDGNLNPGMLCWNVIEYGELASGTTDSIGTDNDLFAWQTYHNRANSFGMRTHGVLFTPAGDPVNFSGGYHCVGKYNPKKDEGRFNCKDRLNLGD